MLAREIGDEKLEEYLRAFGLGRTTGIELPGESAGILEESGEWTEAGRPTCRSARASR
jgi:cell division protein FtsI (penicillin-binding protein 3)